MTAILYLDVLAFLAALAAAVILISGLLGRSVLRIAAAAMLLAGAIASTACAVNESNSHSLKPISSFELGFGDNRDATAVVFLRESFGGLISAYAYADRRNDSLRVRVIRPQAYLNPLERAAVGLGFRSYTDWQDYRTAGRCEPPNDGLMVLTPGCLLVPEDKPVVYAYEALRRVGLGGVFLRIQQLLGVKNG